MLAPHRRHLALQRRLARVVVVLGLTASGCAVQTQAVDNDVCEQASSHVAACLGSDDVGPIECDPDAAAELTGLPCEAIQAGKADALSEVLCDAGFLRHCPVEACADALPATHDFAAMECASLIELEGCAACDYYRCREAQSVGQCGDDGYYLGLGYQYCIRYRQVTEPRLTDEGQHWSARTRRCLMEALETDVVDSEDCEGLVRAGYDTHAGCYRDTGFCELSPLDWKRVMSTIDIEDKDLADFLVVGLECLQEATQ